MPDPVVILLVEDEAPIRRLAQRMLEMDGHKVQAAALGAEAMASLEAESPAVIITDFKLPDMGGDELIRQIRARLPEVPVILTSGLGSDVLPEDSAGRVSFLPKPFSRESLREAVQKALAG